MEAKGDRRLEDELALAVSKQGSDNAKVLKSGMIRMKIIRADGTIEDHGIVSGMYRNPIKNAIFQAYLKLKRLKANGIRFNKRR